MKVGAGRRGGAKVDNCHLFGEAGCCGFRARGISFPNHRKHKVGKSLLWPLGIDHLLLGKG